MKKIFITCVLVVLILCCAFHIGMAYLNFTRQIGFTPVAIMFDHSNFVTAHKGIFEVYGQ
jgi:hypothetical protein